ncbi:hypothetical protein DFJ74DRAFT_23330 [Hyaloraphidium curvatum]|nr:hypothetical protein DFJ74DRAFT_23330 [Hyaloraphidium curvatum]
MSPDGELLESVAIGDRKEFDLEAIAHDPSRPDFLYLGVEHPQQILEYSIEHKRVGRKWDLSEHFGDVPKNRGLEGLAYVPTERSATGGYFVAGVQHDSRLLLFDVDLAGTRAEAEAVVLVAEIQDQPGPDYDISAVSLRGHHLYLLFDSEREMTRVDLDEHHQVLLPVSKGADPSQLPFRIDALKITHAHYKFQILGLEGVAFSEQHAFFCIDPSDDSPKGIVRYDIEQLDRCFLDHGME